MASIREKKDKDGKVRAYSIVVTLGRDEHNKKVYVSKTISRPDGLSPKKEEKEIKRLADEWEYEQRALYGEKKSNTDDRKKKKKIRVSEFIDEIWIKKHVKDGSHTPDTIAFYQYMANDIKAYFKDEKGDMKLRDISKTDILDYLSYLRNRAKTKRGGSYSPTTIKHHFSTLRGILDYAVYIEYLNENPCKKLKAADKPQREEKEIDFLDEDDAIWFMACLESEEEKRYWEKHQGTYLQWKTMINIMIVTGLRRGELVGLRWEDLDKKTMMLSVRRNITIDSSNKEEKDSKKKIHIGSTKGKKIRRVPLSKYIINLLDELRSEREKIYGEEVNRDDYIFCRDKEPGLPLYPTEPTRMVKKYIKRHGLPNVSPHDLRHTAASLAIQSGANVKEIQKLLGHKDAATTLRFYAGVSRKAERETIDGIEGILRPDKK